MKFDKDILTDYLQKLISQIDKEKEVQDYRKINESI